MAFQGNLKEFAVTDVLQLLGNQSKSGALMLENADQRAIIYLVDGRVVSTRSPGLAGDDPLLRFLLVTHRLSDEQHRGILTIQRESRRDLEDLLLNGRYMDSDELSRFIERQILDDVTRLMEWTDGSYTFDAKARWPFTPLVRIPTEATILEVVRRLDEATRHQTLSKDPQQILGLRDLPDPDTLLSEEECEVFGIIDARKTITEVIAQAPLSEYETYESLINMLEQGWIEVTGRREADPSADPLPSPDIKPRSFVPRGKRFKIFHEAGVALVVAALVFVLRLAAIPLQPQPVVADHDVFVEARLYEIELALNLYEREYGRYPEHLSDLVDDRWLAPDRLELPDGSIAYQALEQRGRYQLEFDETP